MTTAPTKTCSRCGNCGDPSALFYRDASKKDGFRHACRACERPRWSGRERRHDPASDRATLSRAISYLGAA